MKVYLVGIGMGNADTLTLGARRVIRSSDLLIGGARMLAQFSGLNIPSLSLVTSRDIEEAIRSSAAEQISVLLSGDTGFFSGAKTLCKRLRDLDVEVLPGISSLSYFCARCKRSWQDVFVLSCHGRDGGIVSAAQSHETIFVLTGGAFRVNVLCQRLCEAGLGHLNAIVGENLSYPEERIVHSTVEALSVEEYGDLSVLMVDNPNPIAPIYQAPGLSDADYCRGDVPMTKEEVRALVVSKLRLERRDVVWDVGAGTGSVSVECALALPEGTVYAIERKAEGIELIEQNRERFGLTNLRIVEGHAPEALSDLPAPDRVFIGGSGGELGEIVATALEKNQDVRIVISAITLETLQRALAVLERWQFRKSEIIQVGISRSASVGSYHMMRAENPIYLISMENPK